MEATPNIGHFTIYVNAFLCSENDENEETRLNVCDEYDSNLYFDVSAFEENDEYAYSITELPKLLDMLEINGCIVTIDAMVTQKEIAEKIISKNADYILTLKENQKNLYRVVKLYLDDIRYDEDVVKSENYHKITEKGHGRIKTRICVISEEIGWLNGKEDWKGINGIGVIYSTVEENGEKSSQSHYFIYSKKGMTAMMMYKRSHWSIENKLHWVLDMAFREDESRARKDNSAENFNVLRQIALNILKSETTFKGSITDKQFKT